MNRLKELREEKGYSQVELSKLLEMEQTNYSKYERGNRSIGIKTLKSLCQIYNISADYILELTDEKRPLN